MGNLSLDPYSNDRDPAPKSFVSSMFEDESARSNSIGIVLFERCACSGT